LAIFSVLAELMGLDFAVGTYMAGLIMTPAFKFQAKQ